MDKKLKKSIDKLARKQAKTVVKQWSLEVENFFKAKFTGLDSFIKRGIVTVL